MPILLSKGSRKANLGSADSHPIQSKRKRQHASQSVSSSENEGSESKSDHEAPHALSSDQLEFTDGAEDGSSAGDDVGGRRRRSSHGVASRTMPAVYRMEGGLEEDGAVMALLGLCGDQGGGSGHAWKSLDLGNTGGPEYWRPSNKRAHLPHPAPDQSKGTTVVNKALDISLPYGGANDLLSFPGYNPLVQDAGMVPAQPSATASLSVQQQIDQWHQKQLSQSLEHSRKAATACLLGRQLAAAAPLELNTESFQQRVLNWSQKWELLVEPMCFQMLAADDDGEMPWVPSLIVAGQTVQWQRCAAPGCRYLLSTGPYCCDHLSRLCHVRLKSSLQRPHLPHLVAGGELECEGLEARVVFPAGSPIMATPARDDMGRNALLHILDLAQSAGCIPNVELKVRQGLDQLNRLNIICTTKSLIIIPSASLLFNIILYMYISA